MALSVAIFVAESKEWMEDLVEEAKTLKVGSGFDDGVDIGPLITPQYVFVKLLTFLRAKKG